MKRHQEKIKDLVEPQAFDETQNVGADPARALAAYRFTDATSDLLARWLDALAELKGERGAARALAGMRGVGKTHALAVFSALAAMPELRAGVGDAHVAASARRLMSRRYVLVRVERGTRQTLAEELAAALDKIFGGGETQWLAPEAGTTLSLAASRAGDATLVLVFDTAFGRQQRVSRDDGPFLSQLAHATEHVCAFIALALDDDIAGADGANAALAGTYQIDYLDPEHLYRVADLYVLRKNAPARAALHEIYMTLRAAVPGFNWTESRFAALYPIHPLVADVSAAVRLYSQTFAFLPFASASAARAVSRPALSLVLLDEAFDYSERELRKSPQLEDAFAAYDELALKAGAHFPVMQRLQAKLILKALFILSLEGSGATAREMCVALLFHDESADAPLPMAGASATHARVAEILARLAELAPHAVSQAQEADGATRYRFQIGASQKFEKAVDEAVARLSQSQGLNASLDALLHEAARARFSDWAFTPNEDSACAARDFALLWRGGLRPGRILRQSPPESFTDFSSGGDEWEVLLLSANELASAQASPSQEASNLNASDVRATEGDASHEAALREANASLRFVWQPAALTTEESLQLRRLLALRKEEKLVTDFGEAARAAINSLAAQAERIWARIYLDDGALVDEQGAPHKFDAEAHAAPTLASALARIFAPRFEARYPEHPKFEERLRETFVAHLIDGLFGGEKLSEPHVQHLARIFAVPLGLATKRGELYALETGDAGLSKEWIREILSLTDEANGAVVPLEEVSRRLRASPYGLLRESQRLTLAALVAQRRIELVTARGDRITRRTLDRSIRWDDVAGVCRARTILHSAEELTQWARLLTGEATLPPINEPAARETVRARLAAWLEDWRARRVVEKFNGLPDEGLTRRVWRSGVNVSKSFSVAAQAIEAALAEEMALEESLQRVADTFADSVERFHQIRAQLDELEGVCERIGARLSARLYLASAEPTGIAEIENLRDELFALDDSPHALFDEAARARFDEAWRDFRARYADFYVRLHDCAAGAAPDAEEINARRAFEELLRGEAWREFETLARLPFINGKIWREAETFAARGRRALAARCELPARQSLESHPRCACGFRLSERVDFAELTRELAEMCERGRALCRRTLLILAKPLAHALEEIARALGEEAESTDSNANPATALRAPSALRARLLADVFNAGQTPSNFSQTDLDFIARAAQRLDASAPVRLRFPSESFGLMSSDELTAGLQMWLDELPQRSLLVEVSVGDGA